MNAYIEYIHTCFCLVACSFSAAVRFLLALASYIYINSIRKPKVVVIIIIVVVVEVELVLLMVVLQWW